MRKYQQAKRNAYKMDNGPIWWSFDQCATADEWNDCRSSKRGKGCIWRLWWQEFDWFVDKVFQFRKKIFEQCRSHINYSEYVCQAYQNTHLQANQNWPVALFITQLRKIWWNDWLFWLVHVVQVIISYNWDMRYSRYLMYCLKQSVVTKIKHDTYIRQHLILTNNVWLYHYFSFQLMV